MYIYTVWGILEKTTFKTVAPENNCKFLFTHYYSKFKNNCLLGAN